MNKNRKLINAFLVSTMMLSGLALDVSAEGSTPVDRIKGTNRVDTSIQVSSKVYPAGSKTVILAGWSGAVDSLTGTMLAAEKDAPLLIVRDENLGDVKKQLVDLGADNVILLGGEAVISEAVEQDLEKIYNVDRVSGTNRYETAVKVARQVAPKHDKVFLTNSKELADALATGPASGKNTTPILLTKKGELSAETKAAITEFGVKEVTIIGGENAVGDFDAELKAAGATTVTRLAGSNRTATAVKIAETYFAGSKQAIVANDGRHSYADALVGGYFGAEYDAPILLTRVGRGLDTVTKNYLGNNAISSVFVLGGTEAVDNATFTEIKEIIEENLNETELEAQEKAMQAVKAYEDAPLTTLEEVAAAEALAVPARSAINAVTDETVKAELTARLDAHKLVVDAAKEALDVETLNVKSVSVINTTGVTVEFDALTEDIDGATVKVTDPAGKVHAVVAQNLKAGATSAKFPFVVVPEISAGTWTVDGKTYEVVSTDASLSGLTTNVGIWNKDFDTELAKADQKYSVYVESDVKSVNFTPEATEGSTITALYDGKVQVLDNGKANTINLKKDHTSEDVKITVIAPDKKTTKEYEVKIEKAVANANNDAFLAKTNGLKVMKTSGGTELLEGYKATETEYEMNVENTQDKVFVTAAANDAKAEVFINGKAAAANAEVKLEVGKNTIEVKVIAENNKTVETYTVVVNRAPKSASEVNTLNSLTLSDGKLENFTPDGDNYTDPVTNLETKVVNSVKDLTITPIATDSKAIVSVEATAASGDLKVEKAGNAYTVKGLNADASNKIKISVTPEDAGAAKVYTLRVTRAAETASDVANLSKLELETGAAAPATITKDLIKDFKGTKTDYSMNVATDQKEFRIDADGSDGSDVEIKVNGKSITDTGALKLGENLITVKVTSANGLNTRTYNIKVNRASLEASDVKTLKSIALSEGTVSGFTADALASVNDSLKSTVSSSSEELTITPKATDSKAHVNVTAKNASDDLTVVENNGSFTVKGLKTGNANKIKIWVTPEDATTAEEYTLTVDKVAVSASDNALLTSIKVSAEGTSEIHVADKFDYTVPVAHAKNVTKLQLAAATGAKITVNGKEHNDTTDHLLSVGNNKFTIVVTAANTTTTKTYNVNVVRAAETASDDARLSEIKLSSGVLKNFDADSKADQSTLQVALANSVKELKVTPTVKDNATVDVTVAEGSKLTVEEVNGEYTVKGLKDGDNVITIKTTSQDGQKTITYTLTANRVGPGVSSNATITDLVNNEDAGLKQAFDKDKTKTEFKSYVTKDVETAKITPTLAAGQTVIYNGKEVTDITVDLVQGQDNKVVFTVLAANKVATKDYTVVINRASTYASTDVKLKAIENVSPGKIENFKSDKEIYTIEVPADTQEFTFKPVLNDANARITEVEFAGADVKALADGTYKVTGVDLSDTGTKDITFKVMAEDNSTDTTYTLKLAKPATE